MEVSHRTGKKYEKQKKDIDTLMDNSIKPYPFLKDSSIEKESLNLLDSYSQDIVWASPSMLCENVYTSGAFGGHVLVI